MTDLTKEHFDKQVTQLLNRIATKDDVKEHFTAIEETLESHTTTLDGMSKKVDLLITEKSAINERFKRYDKFMRIVAEKLDLDLKELLKD